MVNLLAAVGLVFVILALWKGRSQSVRERQELDEYQKLRDQLAETKKEVGSLLEQLESVSERVVEEISATVDEARRSVNAAADGIPDLDGQAVDQDDHNQNDKNDVDEDSVVDNDTPEIIVELTGRPTEIKTYNHTQAQVKPSQQSQVKPGPHAKQVYTGKTILFPRKIESAPEEPSFAKCTESLAEVPPKHQMVYAMAKLGYPEEEIAKQLNFGRGEVRLILQLKRKGEEANG